MVNIVAEGTHKIALRAHRVDAWRHHDYYNKSPGPRQRIPRGSREVGEVRRANLNDGLDGPDTFIWDDGDETLEVQVGRTRDDFFTRTARPTRCLFLGFGGEDWVRYEDDPLNRQWARDVMVTADGTSREVPMRPAGLSPGHDAQPNTHPTAAQTPHTSEPRAPFLKGDARPDQR